MPRYDITTSTNTSLGEVAGEPRQLLYVAVLSRGCFEFRYIPITAKVSALASDAADVSEVEENEVFVFLELKVSPPDDLS